VEIVAALAAQQSELSELLRGLDDHGWRARTRCDGWDVGDVVLHLAQTDDMATASVTGAFADFLTEWGSALGAASSVDEGAARMVEHERGLPDAALLDRWTSSGSRLLGALRHVDPSARVPWVAGELSARTLATTRLAETWIHTGDVADAVGRVLAPTDRLEHVARLAWRTLPYAFSSAGRSMAGPVAFRLVSPGGSVWEFAPGEPASTIISGPAVELCEVAARRSDPSATSLHGEGPDADAVLELVRTYA
jgi:uncharacterized protein (TIGR03084 family)